MSIEFDRDAVACFRFVDCGFDAATGIARLVYAFDDGPELVETVTVPGAPFALEGARAEAVTRALRLLHLVAGVSYYKAAVPGEIRIDGYALDAATAALLQEVYVNGLGEFAYRNGLDLHGRIRFPAAAVGEAAPSPRAQDVASEPAERHPHHLRMIRPPREGAPPCTKRPRSPSAA